MPSRRSLVLSGLLLTTVLAGCARDPQKLKAQYVTSGDEYLKQKRYSEAIIQYRNAVVQDPNFGEGRFKLATAYEATGDLQNALQEYVRAADLMPDNVNAQLSAGKLLIAARQYAEARARAVKALAKEPKNVNGLIVLGNALAGLKDVSGAIELIESAIDVDPSLNFTYANLGVLELKRGDRAAAEEAFARAVEYDPKSIAARLNLGNFYWAAGQREKAEREFKIALTLDPKSVDVNRMLTAFYLTGARRSEAEPYFKAYAATTAAILPRLGLADFYLGSNRPKEAANLLRGVVKDKDGFGPATLRLALIDFQDGRRGDAYRSLEEVLKRYPGNQQALEEKARFLIIDRNYDEAVKITSAVVQADPKAITSHYLRGLALEQRGSADDAIASFRKVLEIAPNTSGAQLQLATLFLAIGDAKTSIDYVTQVLKARPTFGLAHLLLGQALLQVGNLQAAEEKLVPLARANPMSAELQISLGRLYGAKNDFARSRTAFGRALELQPDSLLALNGLVALDLAEKKYDAVRARLDARVAAKPDDAAILYLAGTSHLSMGDADKAEQLLRAALQRDPANIDAYAKLGALYVSQRRLDEARAQFAESAKHQARPVAATTFVGVVLSMQNKLDEARQQYLNALALDPKAAVAANNLAADYAERGGNLDVALQLAQTAKAQLPKSPQVTDTLGWIYYKKGLSALAVTTLREAAVQGPRNPVIHYHLGLAYLKNNNLPEARESLKRALTLNAGFSAAEDAKRALATIQEQAAPTGKS